MKMLNAYYLNRDFNEAIAMGKSLESEKMFKGAEQRLAYAWALHYAGKSDEAQLVFNSMDKAYTNYAHRLEYCNFLTAVGRVADMKQKAAEILEEFENVNAPERKLHRDVIQNLKRLLDRGEVTPKA